MAVKFNALPNSTGPPTPTPFRIIKHPTPVTGKEICKNLGMGFSLQIAWALNLGNVLVNLQGPYFGCKAPATLFPLDLKAPPPAKRSFSQLKSVSQLKGPSTYGTCFQKMFLSHLIW
jgi:hypothetical protein